MAPVSDKEQLDHKIDTELSETPVENNELNQKGEWYVVHTYSGYENKIKVDLTKRVESMNMQDKIFDILIPEEQEIEYKNGKKRIINKRVFPGYVLVNMNLDNESWYAVHHTPGVTGFVGSGTKPIPLQKDEIDKILGKMGIDKKTTQVIDVNLGESVRVISGPFENFEGTVKEILPERGKLRVNISMFGRETPVELEYEQIEKI